MRIPMIAISKTAIEIGTKSPAVSDFITRARRWVGAQIAGENVTREDLRALDDRIVKLIVRVEGLAGRFERVNPETGEVTIDDITGEVAIDDIEHHYNDEHDPPTKPKWAGM